MSADFTFRFSKDFISQPIKDNYQGYLNDTYGETYGDILDLINSTVQEITIPGVNITHPTLRKFKKSSVHANEAFSRELVINLRIINGNINLYPILEEAFHHYDQVGKENLFIGDCMLESRSRRSIIKFEMLFQQCLITDIDLPEVDYRELEPADENFSITLEWNELKIKPVPDFN